MRHGRNQPKLPLEREVGVALSDEEVGERSRKLCGVLSAIDGLRDEVRSVSKDRKDRIKKLETEAKALRQQIQDGYESRKQGDLFVGDDQAKKALATVAEVAGEPRPSEPHAFEGHGKECGICGAEKGDPVHADKGNGRGPYEFNATEPADPIIRTHAAVDRADKKRARVLNRKSRQSEKGGRV